MLTNICKIVQRFSTTPSAPFDETMQLASMLLVNLLDGGLVIQKICLIHLNKCIVVNSEHDFSQHIVLSEIGILSFN